ncbi:unnamed protein product [Owenia fusiformis]|uniref:Uncharacterized protein n=1 Tax=Owenia fusiformis TaxID=6347 RepID=A0A8J1U2L5_OWEFU|nr:unnamed protein product [Owenia fusiformis]
MTSIEILTKDIENIRDLGKRWGMNDAQIRKCLLEAVGVKDDGEITVKPTLRHGIFQAMLTSILVLFILFVGLYFLVQVHEPTEHFIGKNLQHLNYDIFRIIRLAGLPFLHRFRSMEAYYEESCIVNNPYFEGNRPDCESCKHERRIAITENITSSKFDLHYASSTKILKIKNALKKKVSFEDLKASYDENKATYHATAGFVSSNPDVQSMDELFKQEDSTLQNIHIEGNYRKVSTAKALRQLFPRPDFIPADVEVSLDKAIFIDGPKSPLYTLITGTPHFQNIWYAQGSGSRLLRFRPYEHCLSECSIMEHIVEEGDIVYWNDVFWKVDSLPVHGEYKTTISFIANFS